MNHARFSADQVNANVFKVMAIALLVMVGGLVSSAFALPPEAVDYDPSGQIRFSTPAEAEARRQELIKWIWPDGLPTKALPAVTSNIDLAVFKGHLGGLEGSLAASVDRFDANIAPYDYHSTMYLIHPKTESVNNDRLVLMNSGHRVDGPFMYGVNDAANRLLAAGFTLLMTDMPFTGFNTDKTIELPNGGGTVTISGRGSGSHNEIFSKLIPGRIRETNSGFPGEGFDKHIPPVLREGEVYRFFLEPFVQGINHFLHTNPDAIDVSFVGISGGGWSGHMIAAVDVRIRQSFPVAGAYPLYCRTSPFIRNLAHDVEQYYVPLYREIDTNNDGIFDTAAGVVSWLEIFALGGYGPGRIQIQILNLYDSCCFFGDSFETYDDFVSGVVNKFGQGRWQFHSDATHKSHVISPDVLNNVIMPVLVPDDDTVQIPTEIVPIKAPFEMPQLKRPVFADRTCNIADYGAKGDGTTKNTEAIRKAIEACHKAGGGKVLVPEGKWLTGAIHLKSNVNLHMQKGAEIHFSVDPEDYLPVVFTRWAGFEVMNYSPLIYANGCENIAVTGRGKLFGHGKKWWGWEKRLNERDKIAPKLQAMATKGTPAQERVFGSFELGLRPQFISPINCRNVLLEGFTIAEPGPFWTIQFIYCENVIARGLTLHTEGGPNTDGINLDSTRNALVEHCMLDVGDDGVCLKSGINEDGRRVGRPTENVVVRNITALNCHGGIVIGSDMSGGVRNVLAHDCIYDGSDIGIRLKSNAARGGVVENIMYRNITMRKIKYDAIRINTNYSAWGTAKNATHYPTFRNITIKDISCEGASAAISMNGTSHKPIENVAMENVFIKASSGMSFNWVDGLKLINVTSKPASGKPMSFQNCKDVVVSSATSPKAVTPAAPTAQEKEVPVEIAAIKVPRFAKR